MKKIFFLLFLTIGGGFSSLLAQSGLLSARESQLLKEVADPKRQVDTLINWAYEPANIYRERPLTLFALARADSIGYSGGRADCFVKLGHIAADAGQWQDAESFYRHGLHIRDSLHLRDKIPSCYNNLGVVQKKQGKYSEAVALYQLGLKSMSESDHFPIAITLENNLGTSLRYLGRYAEALQHFQKSMELSSGRTSNDSVGLASARLNIGNLLQDNLGLNKAAQDSLNRCLQEFTRLNNPEFVAKTQLALGNNAYYTGDFPQALEYYNKAKTLEQYLAKDERTIILKNRARVYLEQQNYKAALQDFQTSLDTFTAIGNTREIAATKFEIGNFYYEQKQWANAVQYYKQALNTDIQDPGLRTRLLYFLSNALEQMGQKMEAETFTNQYVQSLSQLDSSQTREAFGQMIRYQLSNSILQNRAFEKDKESVQAFALGGFILLGLLLILAVLIAYSNRQKRRLAEQNAEIARHQQQIVLQKNLDLLKNKELENNYARLAGQDEMQRKIGQELHDGVGAMLASVKLNLSPVDEVLDHLPENNRKQYATANRLLGEASEEVRRISHELSSAVLQKFGLKAQLEALADIIPGSGKLQVELATHGLKERLDYKTELHIYRMVQELVHNVVKHAQARNITIQVNRFEHTINVIVEDDGRGFDVEKIRESPGIGMQNLAARVHELNGEMQIDSREGRGTMVSIDIPV